MDNEDSTAQVMARSLLGMDSLNESCANLKAGIDLTEQKLKSIDKTMENYKEFAERNVDNIKRLERLNDNRYRGSGYLQEKMTETVTRHIGHHIKKNTVADADKHLLCHQVISDLDRMKQICNEALKKEKPTLRAIEFPMSESQCQLDLQRLQQGSHSSMASGMFDITIDERNTSRGAFVEQTRPGMEDIAAIVMKGKMLANRATTNTPSLLSAKVSLDAKTRVPSRKNSEKRSVVTPERKTISNDEKLYRQDWTKKLREAETRMLRCSGSSQLKSMVDDTAAQEPAWHDHDYDQYVSSQHRAVIADLQKR